ncbi:MAG: hypothetical protein HQK55_09760, partial [Deltaproteobacteria bacterium]|nr:hypothetical protein [Deltaproteobacteria bacterium]
IVNAPAANPPMFTALDSVSRPDSDELADLKTHFIATFNIATDHFAFESMLQAGFSAQAEQAIYQLSMELLNQGILAAKIPGLDRTENGLVVCHLFSKQET